MSPPTLTHEQMHAICQAYRADKTIERLAEQIRRDSDARESVLAIAAADQASRNACERALASRRQQAPEYAT